MSDENQFSGAADDMLDGTALGALFGGQGAAAGFALNYEGLPKAITDLEHAADFFADRAGGGTPPTCQRRASMGSA